MTKIDMMDILDGIAGGGVVMEGDYPKITHEHLKHRRDSIMRAIDHMARFYRKNFANSPILEYYEDDFRKINSAQSDDELLGAIEGLRVSLYFQ